MVVVDQPDRHLKRELTDSWLLRALLREAISGKFYAPVVIVAAALEVAFMALFGWMGSSRVLGLPGPIAVAIAGGAGILAGPWAAFIVGCVGALAYLDFLADFGRSVHLGVIVLSSLLWIVMSVAIAQMAKLVRRQLHARLDAQRESEELHLLLERGLMPREPVLHPRLHVASFYMPSEQRMRLGGDFFDRATLDDGSLALVIGDVSGHGPNAAALGAVLRGAWRGAVMTQAAPSAIAHTLHHIVLAEGSEEAFVTAVLAWIDVEQNTIRLISAGHPAPLLMSNGVAPLKVKSFLPLGVAGDNVTWHPASMELPPAWTLFFYTDGLVEMRARAGTTERFGLDGLSLRLQPMVGHVVTDADLADIVEGITAASGEAPPDDVAALAVSTKPLD